MIWLIALAIGVVGALFLFVFGRQQHEAQRTRLDVNRELYEQRQQEIAQEQTEGLLSENAARRALLELDRRFLDENNELEQLQDQSIGRVIWVPALLLVLMTVALYYAFGGWKLQQQADDALTQLPELGRMVMSDEAQAATPEQLEVFALGLRQRLLRAPNDAVPWLIYGRVMAALQQSEQAIAAFEKSLQLNPQRDASIISYAELLLTLGGESNIATAGRWLAQLLQREPNHIEGLSLLGLVAYERGDYQQALAAWTILQGLVAADGDRAQALQAAIDDAQQQLKTSQVLLTVEVDISPAAREQLPATGTLFVYVRAVDGAPMPAAVVRQPLPEFPVQVQLSNANAMLADYQLSDLNQWQVQARISVDEQIDRAPGDLDAEPVVVDAATQTVKLTIVTEAM